MFCMNEKVNRNHFNEQFLLSFSFSWRTNRYKRRKYVSIKLNGEIRTQKTRPFFGWNIHLMMKARKMYRKMYGKMTNDCEKFCFEINRNWNGDLWMKWWFNFWGAWPSFSSTLDYSRFGRLETSKVLEFDNTIIEVMHVTAIVIPLLFDVKRSFSIILCHQIWLCVKKFSLLRKKMSNDWIVDA